LRRDLELLWGLASDQARGRGGMGVVRLAELVGRDKSQVSRALRALEQAGVVERDPDSLEYRLGWQIFALAARTGEPRLLQAAPGALRELVHGLGESAHLCVLQAENVLTLITESPQHAFRASGWVGRSVPSYCTSAGRVLLGDASMEDLARRFAGVRFDRHGPQQRVHNLEDLYREVARARATGYATVDEEFEPELVGVAAPVRDFRGRVVAALNISAPKFRLGQRLEAAGKETAAVALELSAHLGWSGASAKRDGSRLT
jgi:DNA-binding IclR family transcriptional regulator